MNFQILVLRVGLGPGELRLSSQHIIIMGGSGMGKHVMHGTLVIVSLLILLSFADRVGYTQ